MNRPDWFRRVAHDLRDPLSPMQTAVYLMRHGRLDEHEQQQMLEIVERQTARMAAMIDELADALRAEENRLLNDRSPVDMLIVAQTAGVLAIAVPSGNESLWVAGDHARLTQLLRHLAELRLDGNDAAPATPLQIDNHGRHLRLQRELACQPELCLDPDRLLQAPLPAALSEGLGLRLPLAAAIVQAHGGHLELKAIAADRLLVCALLPLSANTEERTAQRRTANAWTRR